MRELIGSVMVSSLLLPTFGTLSLPLYFQLPSTFLPSKGRSITTLGTRWHDFFITLFRYLINLFYSLPFLEGYRLEKGHIVPVLCSHSLKKKKKKKKKLSFEFSFPSFLHKTIRFHHEYILICHIRRQLYAFSVYQRLLIKKKIKKNHPLLNVRIENLGQLMTSR